MPDNAKLEQCVGKMTETKYECDLSLMRLASADAAERRASRKTGIIPPHSGSGSAPSLGTCAVALRAPSTRRHYTEFSESKRFRSVAPGPREFHEKLGLHIRVN